MYQYLVSGMLTVVSVTAETASHRDSDDWRTMYQETVPVSFAKLLNWLTVHYTELEQEEEDVRRFRHTLQQLFRTYHKNKTRDMESWEDLNDVTVAAVVAIITKKVVDEGEVTLEQQSKVVTEIVDVMTRVGGADFLGSTLERLLSDDLAEQVIRVTSTKLAAYLGLTSLVNSKNKEKIIEKIKNYASDEVDKENEERSLTDTELLKEIVTVASDMK